MYQPPGTYEAVVEAELTIFGTLRNAGPVTVQTRGILRQPCRSMYAIIEYTHNQVSHLLEWIRQHEELRKRRS